MSQDKDQGAIYAVMEYLDQLAQERGRETEFGESVDVAVQTLGSLFQLSLRDTAQRTKFSLGNQSLATLISSARVAAPASSSVEKVPAHLKPLFDRYVDVLRSGGTYFRDCAEGSAEYETRLQAAAEKFLQKYQTPAASPSTADAAAEAEEHKTKGNTAFSAGQLEEALRHYSRAIELKPAAVYYSNRAAAYTKMQRWEDALKDCDHALALDARFARAHARRGLVLYEMERYAESVAAYEKCLTLDPANAAAIEGLRSAKARLASPSANASSSGGGFPGGGGFDFGSLLRDPNMASMMQQAMRNPAAMSMAQNMMNDPQMAAMAQNLMSNPGMLNDMLGRMTGAASRGNPQGEEEEEEEEGSSNRGYFS